MEFDGALLSKEAAWLPVCCMRTSVVNELPGGIGQVAACILDGIFNSSKANPEMLGVQLQGPDKKLRMGWLTRCCFLSKATMVQDAAFCARMFWQKVSSWKQPPWLKFSARKQTWYSALMLISAEASPQ